MVIPKQLIIEVTNYCNLACRFCPSVANLSTTTGISKFPLGYMDLELFKHIVDKAEEEFPDTTIIPWMNGEPFMHPEYDRMIAYLNERKRRYYVTTNLTIWREEVINALLGSHSGCYQLIVSMDGLLDSRSINAARTGTNPSTLIANVNALLRKHGEMDSKTNIAVKICERGQDWQEIEEYIQYWLNDSEIEYVCVGKPLKDTNDVSMRRYPCQYFDNNFMIVRWNGKVPLCAYNDKCANELELSYGTVGESSSLAQVYNNSYVESLRYLQRHGQFLEPCAKCGFAYTGSGFTGEIAFRSDPQQTKYYFSADYYNMFISKHLQRKPREYYIYEHEADCIGRA